MSVTPNAPSNLQISQRISESSLQVTWTSDAEISNNIPTKRYRVYLDDNSGNDPSLVVDTLASSIANVARLTNLVPGHTYDATVTALNDYGES